MQELLARIEQFRHADAPPAPARLSVDVEEANASCRRAAEFMEFMRARGIKPIPFRRPPAKDTATHGHWIHAYHRQPSEEVAKGWPIIVANPADKTPGIRWALLETGRTYRLQSSVTSSPKEGGLEVPILSEATVVSPYAHPSVRRITGTETLPAEVLAIHGLDILAQAAIELVDSRSAVSA